MIEFVTNLKKPDFIRNNRRKFGRAAVITATACGFSENTCELLFGYIVDKVIFERQRNRVSAVLLVDKQVGVFFVGEEAVIIDHRDVGREKFA